MSVSVWSVESHARSASRGAVPQALKPGAPSNDVRRLVEQDQVEREVVEIVTAAVQIRRTTLNRLVGDRLVAGFRRQTARPSASARY